MRIRHVRRTSRAFARALSFALVVIIVCALGPVARAVSPLRVDTKVLLISPDGTEPAFTAWRVALDAEGVPYDTFLTLQSPDITASTLAVGSTEAKYQTLILTSDDLVYRDPILGYISSLSSSEWQAIHDFETTFSIRQISTYVYPKPSVGMNYPTFAGNLDGTVGQVTSAGHDEFPYLTGPVPVDGVWGYLSTPLNPLTFQTILQAPGGQSLCGIDTHTDTREELVCTMDASQWTTHFKLLSHGLLGWATRGTYLGQLRNYFSAHIDDLFLQSDRWDETSHTNGPPYIRMTPADVTRAKNWSQANNQRLDFLFNADGSGPSDPLTQAILANKSAFGFQSHTYTHLTLNSVDQARIEWEIAQNVQWANANNVSIDPTEITTGGHSGLTNPVTPAAFANQGIQWFGSDASLSKQQSTLGSATSVPRYPTNVYYNVSTQAEQLDEYNYILYTDCRAQNRGGCLPAPVTWSQYVTNSANQILTHVLANDPRPHFFHQANLAENGVFYSVIDEVLRLYHQYRAGALVQPTLSEAGRLLKQQASWAAARTSGAVSGYIQNGMLTVTSTSAVDVPVTGSNVGPFAAGERSGFVSLTPNVPLTIPALGPAAANLPPVASNLTKTGTEDTAIPVTLSATDPDLNPLTYAIVAQPAHGTLSGTAPLLSYTPATNYAGADSFTFKANDGALDSNIATVSISLAAVNDAPVADPKTVDGAHGGTATPLTLSGSDVDNASLTFRIVTAPLHGTLSAIGTPSCTGASAGVSCTAPLTYTPNVGFTGPDPFTYTVRDAAVDAVAATVGVDVGNSAPLATSASVTTSEDAARAITLAGSDPDGDAITFAVVSPPAHGALSGVAPALTYTPDADYAGPDSFTFKTNDGVAQSTPASISINVTPVNDAPTADPKSLPGAHQGRATPLSLTGSDIDSGSLTFRIIAAPLHGALSQFSALSCAAAGAGTSCSTSVSYTASGGYSGADSFTYRVNDGSIDSATTTVSITVANAAPMAVAQSVSTPEDIERGLTLAGTDADSDPLTYSVVGVPAHGTLSGSAPALTYVPDANYNGPDSFTFRASDGVAQSALAVVSITVSAVNDAPSADPKAITGAHSGRWRAIGLSGADIDSSSLSFRVVTQPAYGVLSTITTPSCTTAGSGSACTASISYKPNSSFAGDDVFSYVTNDGSVDSSRVDVIVTVGNAPPVAPDMNLSMLEDGSLPLSLAATDDDGDTLTYAIVTPPGHGSLSGSAPSLTYNPAPDYNGPDSFTYRAFDGVAWSSTATVSIGVAAVNDAPVADPKTIAGAHQGVPRVITLTASDVDNNALTFRITGTPVHGSLGSVGTATCVPAGAGSTCSAPVNYTASSTYAGPDSFPYTVSDGTVDAPGAVVSITVGNSTPVGSAQSLTTPEDVARAITLNASDADGDPLTYTVVSVPLHGTLSGTAPVLTYTPDPDYFGADSLTFVANDGSAPSTPATISLAVTAVNDAPSADPKALLGAHQGVARALVLSGADIDSSALTFRIVAAPAHGAVSSISQTSCASVAGGSACTATISYTAAAGFTGADSFTYTANDGSIDAPAASVSVSVGNLAPSAPSVGYSTPEDIALPITLDGSDPDADALTFSIVSQPAHGTLSGVAPVLTFTPALNYSGGDSFLYRVSDGVASTNATVSLTMTAVNDAPVAGPKTVTGAHQNRASTFSLSGSDVDSSASTFRIVGGPAHGTLSAVTSTVCSAAGAGSTCTGQITYTGAPGYAGADSFTYALNDGSITGAAAAVSITSTNSAPVSYGQNVNVTEGSPWQVALGATDADADALTFTVLSQPAHGTLSGAAPNLTYTPVTGYTGADAFTFRASDGIATTAPATVTIAVIPHLVVFSSSRSKNIDLYRVGSDGLDLVRLTTSSGTDTSPTWSTDGSKITFSSGRDGNNEIYIMNKDGTQVTRLTFASASDTRPVWSPNGTKIAFSSTRSGGGDIYTMDANGMNVRRLTSSGDAETSPSWSPDGTKIVYQRKSDIYTMNSDGSTQVRIIQGVASDARPSWSPTGSLIAYVDSDKPDIYTAKTDGTGIKRLTTNSATDQDPAWNRDGTRLAFSSNRDGNYEIYLMKADGTGQTRLTVNSVSDTLPDW